MRIAAEYSINMLKTWNIESENGVIEILFAIEEAPKGGFTACAVGHSIFTEADTLDELRQTFEKPSDVTLATRLAAFA